MTVKCRGTRPERGTESTGQAPQRVASIDRPNRRDGASRRRPHERGYGYDRHDRYAVLGVGSEGAVPVSVACMRASIHGVDSAVSAPHRRHLYRRHAGVTGGREVRHDHRPISQARMGKNKSTGSIRAAGAAHYTRLRRRSVVPAFHETPTSCQYPAIFSCGAISSSSSTGESNSDRSKSPLKQRPKSTS